MATTATTRVTDLSRNHRIDVNIAADPSTNYQEVPGQEDMKLAEDPRIEADEMYNGNGAMRETNTGYAYRYELKLAYSTNLAGTALDPIHSFLRQRFKGLRTQRAEQLEFGARVYHREGFDDEHCQEGRVYVKSWVVSGGTGRKTVDVVLQGQGEVVDIDNPLGTALPGILGLSPATGDEAGGELISIYGEKFTGVTGAAGVKFGATNATSYVFINDGWIVAIAPAGTAGTVQVKVTTPAGESPNVTADNYVYT